MWRCSVAESVFHPFVRSYVRSFGLGEVNSIVSFRATCSLAGCVTSHQKWSTMNPMAVATADECLPPFFRSRALTLRAPYWRTCFRARTLLEEWVSWRSSGRPARSSRRWVVGGCPTEALSVSLGQQKYSIHCIVTYACSSSVPNTSCDLTIELSAVYRAERRLFLRIRRGPQPHHWCCLFTCGYQDAGDYREARQLLDEGEAYISMPTQQKVMTKVCIYFEVVVLGRIGVATPEMYDTPTGHSTSECPQYIGR